MARAGLAAALLMLCGCEGGGHSNLSNGGVGHGTRRVVITYLIAHGMAESYLMSGRATRAGLADLIRSDHAALAAIQTQTKAPSRTALAQANGAVRALIDITTALDQKGLPAGSRKAASW